MARTRKTEPEIVLSAAAAAPARRKAAASPRKTRPAAKETPQGAVESVVVRPPATNEEIAAVAYSYWVARGYQDGSPEQDWLRAEQELLERTI